MIRVIRNKEAYLWAVVTFILAFCIGYIHHNWFFPLDFHGDAAAMHVLAEAILDQKSLLPADFSYGNQLVFLRSSPFIAFVSIFGMEGTNAFIFGSALSIAFWSIILYIFLSAYFKLPWEGSLFTLILLLPLGYWDSDLILGQQSHLSNVVLSMGLIIFSSLYVNNKKKLFLVVAGVCLFIMSSEAPLRGILVLVPLMISFSFTIKMRKTVLTSLLMASIFTLAYFFNKYLIQLRPVALNHFDTLFFMSTDEIINNLLSTSRETLKSISSIDIISGDLISSTGFVVLSAGLLLIAMYLGFFIFGIQSATKVAIGRLNKTSRIKNTIHKENFCLIQLTAVFGLLVGAFAVATLNPDSSRHYLWSVFLAKLFIFKWIFDVLRDSIERKKAIVVLIGLALFMSFWFAMLVKLEWKTKGVIQEKNYTKTLESIQKVSERTGVRHIYGEDFWRMMPLNTLIPNIKAQVLILTDDGISPYFWLTRPSWSCMESEVLYYLKDGQVDEEIKNQLIDTGGIQIENGIEYELWIGNRVWQLPSNAVCEYP